jgi:predicted MFS family arabinose efflux permease
MYLLVLQGGMAAGSAIWGAVAERFGIAVSLTAAAVLLAVGLVTTRWHHLRAEKVDFRTTVVEG